MNMRILTLIICMLALVTSQPAQAGSEHCGDSGVWIEILGAGGGDLDDGQAASSYLVWQDDVARLLVDVGPGSTFGFDKSGADFNTIEAIALTNLHPNHVGDLVAYISNSSTENRPGALTVLGPNGGGEQYPSTSGFLDRLLGENGLYPFLADALTFQSSLGYRIRSMDIPAQGNRRWARYGSDYMRLAAIPVHHGGVPAVAYRVEIGGQSIVFGGNFSNLKNSLAAFASDADALIVSHAIPEIARGQLRDQYALPSQIGKVAQQANARMLILGHRNTRTRGRESLSRAAMEASYDGTILFANDGECWGL
mgnify:CR=1 FL=1